MHNSGSILLYRFKILIILAACAFAFMVTPARAAATSPAFSLNWAGYVSMLGKFTAISGTWVVPKVANAKTFKSDATWVGIGGVNTADLIQAGTEAITGMGGEILYQAWYELLPDYSQPVALPIQMGDSITVTIAQAGDSIWHITIVNNTTGKSFFKEVHYASKLASAEWVEEMPSSSTGFIPIDNFSTVHFKEGYAMRNGAKISIARSHALQLAMTDHSGKILAMPSALKKDGSSFNISRAKNKHKVPKGKKLRFGSLHVQNYK